ncbi:MAG: metal-sensing transcriptional repressor [Candidatus Absconditabacterales bacterium]|nr:metal-sensing transcriptional repressor [Candidatus Absconditabacterales bacterium]
MATENQKKLLLSLKKIAGMIAKIKDMVEQDRYCVDIAQQIRATIGLLKRANTLLLKNHLQCCGKKKLVSDDPREVEEFIDQMIAAREGTMK